MALSRAEINQRSNEKLGATTKTYKLKIQTIEQIKQLSEQLGISQSQLISNAISAYAEQKSPSP